MILGNAISVFRPVISGGGGAAQTGFVFEVDTTKPGTASTVFDIPAQNMGIYNALVKWGDGSEDTITAWNQSELTHDYGVEGTYIIEIQGDFPYFAFIAGGDVQKFGRILQFGTWAPSSMLYFLWGANNFVADWTDTLDVTNLSGDVTRAFNNSGDGGSISPFPSGFAITLGVRLTQNCQANWDLSVMDHTGLASYQLAASGNNAFSVSNYDSLLIKMDSDGVSGVVIDWNQTNYTIATSGTARANLVAAGCTITDAGGI